MKRPRTTSLIYTVIAACGGFLFGLAACFAVSFFFIILGCPEPRGQVCRDAVELAASISSVWYLFGVPMAAAVGIVTYLIANKVSPSVRTIITENIIVRILLYAFTSVVLLFSLMIAVISAFITSARAGIRCPVEVAYGCSEAGAGEIVLGVLTVSLALAVAILAVWGAYRLTKREAA